MGIKPTLIDNLNTHGYLHPLYAQSFSEIGEPMYLPNAKGWLIKRKIPGTPYYDGMGCYPIFTCKSWDGLKEDLNNLKKDLISVALVTDPFAENKFDHFKEIFPICYTFKHHYITNLQQPTDDFISKKTRKHVRRALREISIEHCKTPLEFLTEWHFLYEGLIKRHNISDIRTFSFQCFEKQLSVPGIEMFLARLGDLVVGAELFYIMNNVVYAHLVALSKIGYQCNASYALDWEAIQHFAGKFHYLDHGSGSGLGQKEDGLTFYKNRWSTEERPVYFCGIILDSRLYSDITYSPEVESTDYFPAYRKGEYY